MKKLSKLKLNSSELMSNDEMKSVVGGTITGGAYDPCGGKNSASTCNGFCIAGEWGKPGESQQSGSCHWHSTVSTSGSSWGKCVCEAANPPTIV